MDDFVLFTQNKVKKLFWFSLYIIEAIPHAELLLSILLFDFQRALLSLPPQQGPPLIQLLFPVCQQTFFKKITFF